MVSGSVDSGCHKLLETVWFVWSKASYSGDKWRCYRCGTGRTDRRTSEYRATQLLICEKLSLAITIIMIITIITIITCSVQCSAPSHHYFASSSAHSSEPIKDNSRVKSNNSLLGENL